MITINKFKILSLLILSGILITPSNIARAEGIYNVSESDLIKLLEKYKDEEIVLEDGLVLTVGQAIDLPVDEGWTIYNENVAEIVDGELVAKSTGSTFVSQQTDDTVYILEVCITEEGVSAASYSRSIVKNVDRDYYKVFIDPGHGGIDNGAVQNGVREDEINLQISKKVEAKLKAKGVEVKMSRYDDTYLSLTERTRMANSLGSDIFVSIHQNSATSSSAKGIETFYYSSRQDSGELATDIQDDLIQSTNATNRGVKTANYAVIKTAQMASSLVECGFISNPTEAQNLTSSSYQDKVAEGIVNGIMDYLNENVILKNNSGTQGSGNSSTSTTVQTGVVNVTTSLNVRSGAGTSYSSIGSLSNGAKVEIVETSGTWYKIKYGSGYGYVSKDYITVSSSSNTTTKPETSTPPTTTTPPTTSTTVQTGVVNVTTSLNVRSGAGTSYSSIGSLSNGAKVEIVETSGTWYKIKYGSGYGYVSKEYVTVSSSSNTTTKPETSTPPTTTTPPTTSITTQTGTVKVSNSLNVRSGAGTSYSVLGSLSNGAKVEIVETTGTWYKIKYGSGYGYVSKDYITVSSSSNTTTKPETSTPPTTTTPPTTSTTVQTGTVKVTGSLNVRSGAGTGYSVVGSLSNGAKVEIVETSGTWYKIKYGSGYGYVSKDYITVSSSSNTTTKPETSTASKTGVVNVTTSLNVRSGAGTSYSSIGSLSKNATVEIVDTVNSWYKIKYGSGYGYVSKDYIILKDRSIAEAEVVKEGTVVTLALKVRENSNYESNVIGTISMGEKISVLEDNGEWSKISYNGNYGHILNEYVDYNIV